MSEILTGISILAVPTGLLLAGLGIAWLITRAIIAVVDWVGSDE